MQKHCNENFRLLAYEYDNFSKILTSWTEIKWLQAIHNVKLPFTQKQIPIQNEKFSLLSANKVSVWCITCVKYRAPFGEFALHLDSNIHPCIQ